MVKADIELSLLPTTKWLLNGQKVDCPSVSGVHIEEEEEEEEVDTSLSGRLLSLLEKVKSLRQKKEEVEEEPEEEPKPSQ